MPRGQPDYGLTTPTSVASGISDPGEAAARLGSINVYDRRGWTVWMDDFEGPVLKWGVASSAGSSNPALSTGMAWMGVQSVLLSIVAGADEYSLLRRQFPVMRLGRIGIEFFLFSSPVRDGEMVVSLDIYDGTNISNAELILNSSAQTATIVTAAGNVVVSTNAFNTSFNNLWVPFKLVVDMDTDRYVRLLIGPNEIDLSTHELVDGGLDNDRMIDVSFNLESEADSKKAAYIDNFILTQNEP